jgi:site-specific recombinase XerD
MPATSRLWTDGGRKWVDEQRRRGKYEGPNGETIVRLLGKVAAHLEAKGCLVPPKQATEETLVALSPVMGSAPKTRRCYYGYLGGFLMAQGNPVVKTSGLLQRIPTIETEQPRLTATERNAMFNSAVGQERVVLAFMNVGLRRVEVLRMKLEDLEPAFVWTRGKGYAAERSRQTPLNETIRQELAWYLPLRASWAERATEDIGHLLCWMNGSKLQGYSWQSIDRLVHSAGNRIGKHVAGHMLRRTTAEMLRDAGATIWEIQAMLGHRSISTTESYLTRLDRHGKLAKAAALLEVPRVA